MLTTSFPNLGQHRDLHPHFFFAYQPIVRADNRGGMQVTAHEMLLRSRCGVHPQEAIRQLQLAGRLFDLLVWQVTSAIEWSNGPGATVSINALVEQFEGPEFAFEILQRIDFEGADASRIWIEMVEYGEPDLSRSKVVDENVRQLTQGGVRVLLDDFGEGYGTLRRLREHDFSAVKLSGDLVMAAHGDKRTRTMLHRMVEMLTDIQAEIIAEAVVDERQSTWLHSKGVDMFQSYLYGRPV